MSLSRRTVLKFAAAILVVGGLWFAQGVFAQNGSVDTGLNFATQTGLSQVDPRVVVVRVIRYGLGLLGVFGVALLIRAGYIWMTARGDEEKISKAKLMLKGGIIGLAIILASFAIVSFILSRLMDASGANPTGGVCSPACASGQFCCSGVCSATQCSSFGPASDSLTVLGTAPSHQSINIPRNAVVRFKFSRVLEPASVNDQTFLIKDSAAIAGVRSVYGDTAEFVPSQPCEAPNADRKCFPKDTIITVEVKSGGLASSGIRSVDGKDLVCGGASRCLITFTTGNYIDTQAPLVNISTLQVCATANNQLLGNALDDFGVSKIDFFANNVFAGGALNPNPFPGANFAASAVWNAAGFKPGDMVKLTATAYDLDSNSATAEKSLRVSASHCCNGLKDGDEKDVDCGGSCLACNGDSCQQGGSDNGVCSNDLCASGFCSLTGCLCETRPEIRSVTPAGGFCTGNINKICFSNSDCSVGVCDIATPNGAAGNFITISGSGFGSTRGTVTFNSENGPAKAQLADNPDTGNPICGAKVWTDKQIIVVVPEEAVRGRITVTTFNSVSDTTGDAYGPLIGDFIKNTISRPGLCSVTPGSGKKDDDVEYNGVKFTGTQPYFGNLGQNVRAASIELTNDKNLNAKVPNLVTGETTTYVSSKDTSYSNFIAFTKDSEPYDGPIISAIEPATGPVGQYVTLRGSGFGATKNTSKVYFGDISGREADYAFPEVCAQSVWTDKQIIVKVPAGIQIDNFPLTVARAGYPETTSAQRFQVTTGSPDPGLCRVDPNLGQPNTAVTFWGEYFQNKTGTSAVKFYDNQVQSSAALTFWDIDQSASGIKPWKVVTTVPQSAATGPLRVIAGESLKASNPYNFAVGGCSIDADCGTGATCCAAGLPEAGKCKADAEFCYGLVATSVYQWRFSTTTTPNTCAPDQTACGSVCCASGACENASQNKCRLCPAGQNQCGNNKCCNTPCKGGANGQPSYCADPASCSGYNGNQCVEGYLCPNAPGQCSPTPPSGNQTVTGQCGAPACDAKPGCENRSCTYNTTLNRCVKNGLTSCSLKELKDELGEVIKVNNVAVVGTCAVFDTKPRWHIAMSGSCPGGWIRLPGNKCVDTTSNINPACSVCGTGQSCIANGDKGTCVVGDSVCSNGSTCDLGDNKCKTSPNGTCTCCCRKDQVQQDCCAGLSCGGSCGSGSANLGMCSGCAVRDAQGNIQQAESDLKCSCVGHTGQYCSITAAAPGGVCADCSSITDPADCSRHTQCCVDARNGNRCESVIQGQPRVTETLSGGDDDDKTGDDKAGDGKTGDGNSGGSEPLQFCGYFKCENTVYPNQCNGTAGKLGDYPLLLDCNERCPLAAIYCSGDKETCSNPQCGAGLRCDMSSCECKPDNELPGDVCRNQTTGSCTLSCTAGYQCLTPELGGTSDPDDTTDTSCRCCCKPPTGPDDVDTCKLLNTNLNCVANQESCKGPNRGACCGCTADSQCGDPAITGCGLTGSRCCRARPTVAKKTPDVNAENVCRNPTIEAVFDQLMDKTSFGIGTGEEPTPNVMLIGDYGSLACPNGYDLVAKAESATGFAGVVQSVKKTIARVLPFLLTKPAFAEFSNFCVVSGTAIGTDASALTTKVNYRLQYVLEENRKYYVVLKGDPALIDIRNNPKDHYNTGIMSLSKIGLNALGADIRIPIFNHTEFKNAEVWSFTTGDEICQLDSVKVNPSFHLFQSSGQLIPLNAQAYARNGQPIDIIPSVYDWSWKWESANPEVVKVEAQSATPSVADATSGSKQDAQTLGKATATITADTQFQPSGVGQVTQGSAQLRVFLCQNPWPIYPPFPTGTLWPWKEETTGFEFYYCRDRNGQGTADDLPAIKDSPLNTTGGRSVCMSGTNKGKVCTSNIDCGNASCYPEVLKEFFFFREAEPGVAVLTGKTEPSGGRVTLSWPATANADKYKLYYGFNPGQYMTTVDIPGTAGTVTRTIEGLANGVNYYFAVTSANNKNQESSYSNEVKLKPMDTEAPPAPNASATGGDEKISVFWAPVSGAVRYIAYIGSQPRNGGQTEYAYSRPVTVTPPANTPNITFTGLATGGLNNESTYYLSVRSIDMYGNISAYSPEMQIRPNRPTIVSAVPASQSVVLTWLPFAGARSYVISYPLNKGGTQTLTIEAGRYSTTISNLTNGVAYPFTLKVIKTNGGTTEESPEVTATPCTSASCAKN